MDSSNLHVLSDDVVYYESYGWFHAICWDSGNSQCSMLEVKFGADPYNVLKKKLTKFFLSVENLDNRVRANTINANS